MKSKDFIIESTNTNLLIIDVQPEYDNWCKQLIPGVTKMIEQSNGRVVIVYNDFGGGDSADNVYHYLAGHDEDYDGYDYDEETDDYVAAVPTNLETKLQSAEYMQKEFGFLRTMIDQNINDAIIIEILRTMYMHKVNDSRDLELETMSAKVQTEIENNNYDWDSEGISVQDWIPIRFLKSISPFYMMGGGRNECLREIELLCNAFNIRYKRFNSLIY